jgi:2-polyprenyl-3-methyl-5-hydroxy-6-metoxy-1,4-benzoquinol methylase
MGTAGHSPRADWQLPTGVSRGLWDYAHDAALARAYDAGLTDCPLLTVDQRFAEKHFDRHGRLIDLGCGTGRLLVPFARRGFWVLGVDLSEEMLRVAREKARAAGVQVHLLKANLVELGGLAGEAFDHAACLFSTLGMISGTANRARVLAHAYRLLRPGGKLVLHAHNLWFNLWDRAGRRWLLRYGLGRLLGREGGDRPMPPHQGVAGLALHHFTRRELVRLVRGAGFRAIEVVPVSLRADGRLRGPGWLGRLWAYGYLLAAERPA